MSLVIKERESDKVSSKKSNSRKKCMNDCDLHSVGKDNTGRSIIYCFGACGGRKIS